MLKIIKNKKAFTLIELIVTITVLGVLVLLASPRFFGHTQDAQLTKGFANARTIQKASEQYYMDHEDWPRLTDEPYTSEEIESYSERIFDSTGQEVNLDPEGNYYDIDYDKLSDYVQVPDDKKNYILQNPVGKVFYMENLNETGIARVNYNQVIKNEEDTFEFTATFTNAGSTGRTGPTQSQLDNAYAETALEGLVSSQNGIQLWTVPKSGIYRIETYGAQGGTQRGASGGLGAIMKADFYLEKSTQLKILIGQNPIKTDKYDNNSSGGGGGTFVATLTNKPIIIAGGGGGSHSYVDGVNASIRTNGTRSSSNTGNPGIDGAGGSGGRGGGGGGFYGNAPNGSWLDKEFGGISFINGGSGGLWTPVAYEDTDAGGFGGGGSTHGNCLGGGGGGGYSGGANGSLGCSGGGGGGSYNSGANQVNSVGNTGHGKVIITYIGE